MINELDKAIIEIYGERCGEDQPGCPICDAWQVRDNIDQYEKRKLAFLNPKKESK